MKRATLALLVLCSASAALAQAQPPNPQAQRLTKQQLIQRVCHGTELSNGPEYDEIVRIKQRLAPVLSRDTQHHIYVALVTGTVINAWNADLNASQSLICVPISMVHFMSGAEGELGFIVSHEIGHAVDDACRTPAGRAQVAVASKPFSAFVGGLLGGRYSAAVVQQSCESRADAIGFAIFNAAAYNPFDAAGAFGRLEMYLGDTSTGIAAQFAAFGNDHPVTADRIKDMRAMLMNRLPVRSANGN